MKSSAREVFENFCIALVFFWRFATTLVIYWVYFLLKWNSYYLSMKTNFSFHRIRRISFQWWTYRKSDHLKLRIHRKRRRWVHLLKRSNWHSCKVFSPWAIFLVFFLTKPLSANFFKIRSLVIQQQRRNPTFRIPYEAFTEWLREAVGVWVVTVMTVKWWFWTQQLLPNISERDFNVSMQNSRKQSAVWNMR